MSESAKARGATGFLFAGDMRTVSVKTIGTVYEGRNKRDAEREFRRWTKLAKEPIGRAAGKSVMHTIIKSGQQS